MSGQWERRSKRRERPGGRKIWFHYKDVLRGCCHRTKKESEGLLFYWEGVGVMAAGKERKPFGERDEEKGSLMETERAIPTGKGNKVGGKWKNAPT